MTAPKLTLSEEQIREAWKVVSAVGGCGKGAMDFASAIIAALNAEIERRGLVLMEKVKLQAIRSVIEIAMDKDKP